MENGKLKDFIETMGYNDNILKYKEKYYLFVGFDYNEETKTYTFTVHEVNNKGYGDIIGTKFQHQGTSPQDCIENFLKAKIWDGKSFYEAEKEMTWID